MQFRVLGPLEVRASDGRPVHLGAQKHRVLLGTLLLAANRWVEADRLVEALWADRPPPSVASALRTYISALRGGLRLGPDTTTRIEGRRGAYLLTLAPEDLDLLVFEDLAARGQKALADGDAPTAADRLHRALALWRGQLLEDVPLEGGFGSELARLEELRLTTLESGIEARLSLGRAADVVGELRAMVAAHPLRERLQGLWMTALYRAGQQAEALAAYRSLRERLVGELGIEPSPPLQRLHRQILSADPGLDPPAEVPEPVIPRQLPSDVAWFTGREAELFALTALRPAAAGPPRLFAIDGVAGVGKSALAVHAAHRLAEHFPDGHLYADLAGATGEPVPPLTVLYAFLRALGASDPDVATMDEAAAKFRAHTATRRLLLVLDNARDVAQIQPLLPAAPGCAVLITSRRVLSTLDGARLLHLDVLQAPEAVRLLGQLAGPARIAAEQPAALSVAGLCGYLPLALRIAGARLAARPGWPVRALVDRLADAKRRLDELQVGDLGVRASFQVSLHALRDGADLLDRAAAGAFPLLGVLDGMDLGVPVAARLLGVDELTAEAELERLVDAQLLDSTKPGRYHLHDLLRLFAQERAEHEYSVTERDAALLRAFIWYEGAGWASLRLLRPGHHRPLSTVESVAAFESTAEALDWLEAERGNLLAAIGQATRDPALVGPAIGIAQALVGFFQVRGYWPEWIGANETVLALAERTGNRIAAGYAHRDIGVAHELRGDYDQALAALSTGLSIFREAGDGAGQAASLTSLAVVHHRQGRYDRALECHRESLAIRRQLGDERGQAVNLSNLGVTYHRMGDTDAADEYFRAGLVIFQRLGDHPSMGTILTNLGSVYEDQGRYEDAVDSHRRGLAIFRELGDLGGQATTLNNLGGAYRQLGQYAEALAAQRETLALADQVGDRFSRAEGLRELGCTWSAMGDPAQARRHWTEAYELFTALGVPEAAELRELLERPQ